MTRLLTVLFGRLPIGWLQLIHNRTRFAAAIAGVAFANILIFMQLGFLGALMEGTKLPYGLFASDILISASDANTLSDGSNLPRQRLYQALAAPGVAEAAAIHLGKIDWQPKDGNAVSLHVFGVDPGKKIFASEKINRALEQLKLLDFALIDRKTRNMERALFDEIDGGTPVLREINDRTLTLAETFEVGSGFEADGYMIVSDQTFLRLFPGRVPGAPTHIAISVEPGNHPDSVVKNLRERLPSGDSIVRTLAQAAADDQKYQTTERPIGVVFGFGIIIGVLVGIIIVYQVLSTDVTDHLGEYATLKAVGYRQIFFLGIVFEEALILALFGFVPGLLIALGFYELVSIATGLPVVMSGLRPLFVLAGTILMCVISGAIATRRLAGADPADLF